jgi:hypothetical protein
MEQENEQKPVEIKDIKDTTLSVQKCKDCLIDEPTINDCLRCG